MTDGVVTIAHEDQVTLPTTTRMMVETGDWARIRRNVGKLGEPLADRASTLASIVLGAALALLGINVSAELSRDTNHELLIGLWVAFGLCMFFGLCFFLIGRTERRRYRVSNLALCADMDDIASRANHPGLGVPPPQPAIGLKRRLSRMWHGDPPAPSAQPG